MKESGHWYDYNGTAVFEVPNKSKGGMRPTKITDARALGLYPSVTTIFKVLAKPELDRWKQTQVLLAAMTLPRKPNESEGEFVERIMEDAFKQVDDAADLGTRVHKALEDHLQGRPYDESLSKYIGAVDAWIAKHGIVFKAHEVRVVDPLEGYAGTTDGIITATGREGIGILDFKTRKSKPDYKMTPWQTEPMQIAAYGSTRGASFGVNVFISTTEEGRVEDAWYEGDQLEKEFSTFRHIAKVWQHFNKYTPPVERKVDNI